MPLSRPKKRRAYPEGTVFAVPLRGGGYAVGLVARVGRRGTTLGYFFGPRREKVPVLSEVAELNPEAALLVELFGDLGLMEGHWPIIGLASSFDRRRWPLPPFGRIEEFTGRAFR